MNDQHDPEQLAAYAIGLLDGEDARAAEAHVAGCARCRWELAELREVDAALRRVPPELFLDGPPPLGGELVLQRTLRQVRKESGARRERRLTLVAAVLAALIGAGVAGVALGRSTVSETITAAPTMPAETGSRLFTGFDPSSGARLTVTVTPAAGWVRVKATAVGIPAGERCMLVVLDRNRDRYIAASWLVSPVGEETGTTVDGAAIVAPEDVTAVAVANFEGREFVIARS
ncbi:MAG TPA: zf-HC2 domain-containing protein [Pseudonocardiaceae bacterium]|nr:zf-HC2 domain-containing protein [Pseudonocardiaceae bacterium]